MAELQNPDPLVEAVAKARADDSRRPDLKLPTGRLNQIGKHVYIFSGEIVMNNNTVTQMEFSTSSRPIKGVYNWVADLNALGTNKMIGWKISFNDIVVLYSNRYMSASYSVVDFDNNHPLIIPPFTRVKIEVNTQNTSNIQTFGWIIGEVI